METRLSSILKKIKNSKKFHTEELHEFLKQESPASRDDTHSLCVHDMDEEHGFDDGW